jgi:hypothetical protein
MEETACEGEEVADVGLQQLLLHDEHGEQTTLSDSMA